MDNIMKCVLYFVLYYGRIQDLSWKPLILLSYSKSQLKRPLLCVFKSEGRQLDPTTIHGAHVLLCSHVWISGSRQFYCRLLLPEQHDFEFSQFSFIFKFSRETM